MCRLLVCFCLLGCLITVTFCSTKKETTEKSVSSTNQKSDTVRIANDSLEYEVIIFEPGFNAWLATQRPRGHYGMAFLENRNRIWVREYNLRVQNPTNFDPDLYPLQIDYDFTIDYGYEVNYLLYHYLKYFQEKYNQNLR